MANYNVIYEKKFPEILIEDDGIFDDKKAESSDSYHPRDSAEICKRVFESTVHVIMPERVENIDYFVKMAQELAEIYEIDTTVTEYEDKLVASFIVNTYNTFSDFKKIILFCDGIGFRLDNDRIFFDLIYYTHATFRNGKMIYPYKDLSL